MSESTQSVESINTIKQHLGRDIPQRLGGIGISNIDLLWQIKNCQKLEHHRLKSLRFPEGERMTSAEILYRILFLEAIGLIDEERQGTEIFYILTPEADQALH